VPSRRLSHLELALPAAALLTLGCGLIDDDRDEDVDPALAPDAEAELGAEWCAAEDVPGATEVTIRRELENDGTWTVATVSFLDAEGRELLWLSRPNDDAASRRIEYTLDADGNVTLEVSDDGGDGVELRVTATTYDDEGRPTVATVDSENDGTVDSIITWDYTVPGVIVHSKDEDLDGEPDATRSAFYSESGNLIREELDSDADDSIEQSRAFSYDGAGLVTSEVRDTDGDGDADYVSTREYDDSGRLRIYTLDPEGDGAIDVVETYEYDDAGLLLAQVSDYGADGTDDSVDRFIYDAEGRLVRVESAPLPTGAVTFSREYEYGDTDVVIRSTFDRGDDGHPESVTTRTACD
jgi:hypothetical protein